LWGKLKQKLTVTGVDFSAKTDHKASTINDRNLTKLTNAIQSVRTQWKHEKKHSACKQLLFGLEKAYNVCFINIDTL
jgi:hypothetical protein